MDITPLIPETAKRIQSVGAKGIKVNGQWMTGPMIVTPEQVLEWDGGWDALTTLDVDIILYATGPKFVFPSAEQRKQAAAAKASVEFMDVHATARTYGVLMSEGRQILACFPSQTECN